MTNKPHARPAAPAPPSGDFGLGLCLPCLGDMIAGEPVQPRFGVTLAPLMFPPGQPQAIVPVPFCFEHLKMTAEVASGQRPILLVPANGSVPR